MDRCSDAEEEVKFLFLTDFVNVRTGDRYRFSEGTEAIVQPGCDTVRFSLDIPRDLKAQLVIDRGDGILNAVSQWRMEGSSIAVDKDNAESGQWVSETFQIVDDNPTLEGDN